jgi:endo-beta-N-acetylglucosaminidase D
VEALVRWAGNAGEMLHTTIIPSGDVAAIEPAHLNGIYMNGADLGWYILAV